VAKIVFDTNFLLVPFQFGVDVFKEAERLVEERTDFVTLSPCVEELRSLASGRGGDARAARAAMVLVEKLKIIRAGGSADRAIEDYAVKENAVVGTNDRRLRKKLKEKGVRVIGLRSGSRLAFV